MRLADDDLSNIIAHRVAGCGIRVTGRLCGGIHRDTIMKWSRKVGAGCARLLDRKMRGLRLRHVQFDEFWTFVHTKESTIRQERAKRRRPEHGEAWGFVAEDTVSRAVFSFALGKRTPEKTNEFVQDVAARVVGVLHITTDGYPPYRGAIRRALGTNVHISKVTKTYKRVHGTDRLVSAKTLPISGRPNMREATTVHVERSNGTWRAMLSQLSRKTLKFAKNFDYLKLDLALMFAVYNFVDIHGALKMTPAQALGITDHQWTIDELIEAALAEPEPVPLEFPQVDTTEKALTENEKAVFDVISALGTAKIGEIYPKAFPHLPPFKAHSWTRNQLRGLCEMKLVEKVGKGLYQAIAPEVTAA